MKSEELLAIMHVYFHYEVYDLCDKFATRKFATNIADLSPYHRRAQINSTLDLELRDRHKSDNIHYSFCNIQMEV